MKNMIEKIIKKIITRYNLVNKEELYAIQSEYEKRCMALEHKIWQYNTNTNILLYEMYLEKSKKRKNFSPLVSIIMPVYNGSNYLKLAIDSALNQTYKNIEIIVVNDGSTDGGKTKKVAKKYGDKIFYYEKENGGVSSALNFGISKMKGEYFAWLSHDDLMEPQHIEKLVEYLSIKGNEKTIPYAAFKIVDENGRLKIEDTISAQMNCFDYKTSVLKNEYTLLQGEINGGSVLIPKAAFSKYGLFDEKQKITQERDMWDRLIKEYKFINIPYETAIIRSHSKQVTNTNPRIKIETDKKNLEIIKNISDDKIKQLGLNKSSFYDLMRIHYLDHNNLYMTKEMEKLQKKALKGKN